MSHVIADVLLLSALLLGPAALALLLAPKPRRRRAPRRRSRGRHRALVVVR